ncbi:ABC transporter permease, partial [candidate division KSB1 bacterium]|nr:ABC transporter permease [candidate division KSB1 bacterium]NIR71293.1 ABC transporter permease [candidate division KSB1 bacterium]NIS24521.1 ABC transporter permease [candidate division KSB1 bacterium]NIT71728.1 ABC transporter permease [candidate division KSB1 bacterium]NIU25130.1 ABC transporter permease [candidate division KSB1 bacterium]
MLRNYLKIAFRTFWKHKTFSVINLIGLAVSLAVCLLLIAFIRHQQRFDQFHTKADRIYRVITDIRDQHIGRLSLATTPAPLAEALRTNHPQIAAITQIRRLGMKATYENTTFSFSGIYAEPSFFELFDFPFISGDVSTVLREPFSIVLTEKLAQQFFGTANAVGKVLIRENGDPYIVTGVMRDPPAASHLQFEALVAYATLQVFETRTPGSLALDDWQYFSSTYTYLLLSEDAALADLRHGLATSKLRGRYHPDRPNKFGQTVERFDLQALTDINLGRELSN